MFVVGVVLAWQVYGYEIVREMREKVLRAELDDAPVGSLPYKLKRLGYRYDLFVLVTVLLAAAGFTIGVLLKNPAAAVMLAAFAVLFLSGEVDVLYRNYQAKIDEQAETMLQMCASLYATTGDIVESLAGTVECLPDPMRREVQETVAEYRAGRPLAPALMSFAERVQNRDIDVFVRGLLLSEQYGADTVEVVKGVAEVIWDRILLREELKNEMRGQSATVTILLLATPVALAILTVFVGEARAVMTGTILGRIVVCVMIAVEYIAWKSLRHQGVTEKL